MNRVLLFQYEKYILEEKLFQNFEIQIYKNYFYNYIIILLVLKQRRFYTRGTRRGIRILRLAEIPLLFHH